MRRQQRLLYLLLHPVRWRSVQWQLLLLQFSLPARTLPVPCRAVLATASVLTAHVSCPAALPLFPTVVWTRLLAAVVSRAAALALCSSTAWSYNLNLPDGTVCSAQGGTCSAGQCVTASHTSAAAVTYAWTYGTWPTTCPCSGNQTRAVSCVGTQGAGGAQVYADSYCINTGVAKPTTWQSCSIPTSCFPYAWQYTAWSSCSQSCDGGVSTRTASCYWQSSPAVQVDSAYCSQLPLAATQQSCNTQQCTYQYVSASTWSACTASCGGGTQTRTSASTCQRSINSAWQQQPMSACQSVLHYAINDTQVCNTNQCDTYAWQYGGWGACSVACGGGQSTRSSWCLDVTTGVQAAASVCSAAFGAPVTSTSCGSQACPSYQYVYGNWSTCSATCGGGTMTRTAQCFDSVYSQWYGVSTCAAVLGAAVTTSSCNTQACPTATYEWQWSAWGACPVVCGGGNQTRQVMCVSLTPVYMPVASSNCPISQKPVTWQSCGAKSCNIYSWSVTAWSGCSATCGGGTQTRAVYCQNFWTGQLSDPSTCSQYMTSPQPATSQVCNTQACNAVIDPTRIGNLTDANGWMLGDWGQCTRECGGGWQYRDVTCSGDVSATCTNLTAASNATAPARAQECNTPLCPAVWQTGAWSQCSTQCGGGWMNRSVSCVSAVSEGSDSSNSSDYSDSEIVVVSDSRCSALSRPSSNGDCNFAPCPAYHYSDWSSCSAACGAGVQHRVATCTRYDGLELSAAQCAGLPIESLQQVCQQQACPHLHITHWSDCDKPCGGRGSQQRQLTCRLPHTAEYAGMAVSMAECTQLLNQSVDAAALIVVDGPGATYEDTLLLPLLPSTTRSCNPQVCPAYYWQASPVVSVDGSELCSVSCGGGVEALAVGCYSGVSDELVSDEYCLASARPNATRPCNTQSCDGPVWVASAWSDCSAVCGAGIQSRNVSCRDEAGAGQAVDDTECLLSSQPAVQQSCVQPASVCWGVSASLADSVLVGDAVNGVCDEMAGECVCRSGYGGVHCEESPSIASVRLSTEAVVVGDVLMLEWSSSANIPHVSVSLHRANASSDWSVIGSYLTQYTANYGEWTWSVPSWLQPGSDYFVRVQYSASVYSDSPLLSVLESACGYVECGEHGVCQSESGTCACSGGWSGSECSVSPCASLRCNWDHAEQCNELAWLAPYNNTAEGAAGRQCECVDGWSGPLCATPPQCTSELECLNGGDTDLSTVFIDVSGSTDAHYCGRCKCTGRWQGNTCSICPITCANGGVVDDQCTTCSCPVGYYGSACQSRYYDITMQLELSDSSIVELLLDDVAAMQRLEQSAASELASAAGFASLSGSVSVAVTVEPVSVQSADATTTTTTTTTHIQLHTRLAYASVMVASFDVGSSLLQGANGLLVSADSGHGAIAAVIPQLLQPYKQAAAQSVADGRITVARSLLQAYTNLTEMMADADSVLYSGEVMARLLNASQSLADSIRVVDPTGLDQAAIDAIVIPQPSSRFVATQATLPSASSRSSSSTAASSSTTPPSSSSTTDSSSSSSSSTLVIVAAVLVSVGVLLIVGSLLAARYRTKLSSAVAGCPISIGGIGSGAGVSSDLPPAGQLSHAVSAPSSHISSSAASSPAAPITPLRHSSSMSFSQSFHGLPRLPSAGELEMVESANSDMPELDYYQRSISDSSVAYQLHRSISSPEPMGQGYAIQEEDHLEMQHMNTMRRATSMDELPSPPALEPSISCA